MAASYFVNTCRYTPTAGGTADFTYSSAVTGYQSPSSAGVVNGRQYSYRAESATLTEWEEGKGTYNTGTGVLARTTIIASSTGSKVSFSAAPQVALVALADDLMPMGIGAAVQASPTTPTGTTSATDKMMGLGSTCAVTPTISGRLKVEFFGALLSTGGFSSTLKVYYGTGSAPANGAAVTGTQLGNRSTLAGSGTSNLTSLFANGGVVTGLTVGTAYWFDLAMNSSNVANTAGVDILSFNAFEF
jgi:hypothetical protein